MPAPSPRSATSSSFARIGTAEDTDATIRTQVINKGEPIQMDYRLEKDRRGL